MERLRTLESKKLTSGQAANVADLFEQVIKPQFVHKDNIRALHQMLMRYVDLDGPTLFLRLYGSAPKDSYHLLRRGFLTEFPDKTRMVFCDNTFSMIFAGLKIGGLSVSEVQLAEYLKQTQLICSFGLTTKEKELSYYNPSKAIRVALNSKGWYQAHIKPTGYGFGEISKKNLQKFFPNPDRNEWDANRIRKTSTNLTDEEKQLLTAHFIRLVHPLNSFLVPKPNHMLSPVKRRIGEEAEVIEYVRNYLRNEFPVEYEEFEKISLGYSFAPLNTTLTDLKWSEGPIQIKSSKSKTTKMEKKLNIDKSIAPKAKGEMIEEVELDNNLERWLQSIGKETFVEILLPALLANKDATIEEIAREYPKFATYKTQKSRHSTARSIIFNDGLVVEALQIIIDSSRLDKNLIDKAKLSLENYLKSK